MPTAGKEEEELEELPPLDHAPSEELEGPEDEATPLLAPVEEDLSLDDEEPPSDLEIGVAIEELDAGGDEPEEFVLDIAALLAVPDEDEPRGDGDAAGPAELDLSADMADESESWGEGSEEGVDEPTSELVSEELPELDADEPGSFEDDASWLSSDALRDEDLPPLSVEIWTATALDVEGSEPETLALAGQRLWVGGNDIRLLDAHGAATRVPAPSVRHLQLCALGQRALSRSANGEIWRVEPSREPERVAGHREALGMRPSDTTEVELHVFPELSTGGLLAHAGASRLALSTDAGSSWSAIELGGRVVAVAAGSPTRLLLLGAEGHALSCWRGERWQRTALDAQAEEVAASERVLAASLGDVVALASAERGLVVSADAGVSFSRVPGCLHATAICAGKRAGRTRLWVGVFVESEERGLVLEIDAQSHEAEIICELRAPEEEALLDGADARMRALLWDEASGRLWVASQSGLCFVAPPPRL